MAPLPICQPFFGGYPLGYFINLYALYRGVGDILPAIFLLFSGDENMKKTVRNAVLAAMVLTTVCGGTQMAWASNRVVVNSGVETKDLSNISVNDSTSSVVAGGTGTLNSNTEEINISNIYAKGSESNYGVIAQTSGTVNLGDENVTKSINVTVKGAKPTGLISFYHYGAKINVAGDNFNVNVHGVDTAYGIWVQSNIPTEDKDPIPAEVNINAKNTVIDVSTDVDSGC